MAVRLTEPSLAEIDIARTAKQICMEGSNVFGSWAFLDLREGLVSSPVNPIFRLKAESISGTAGGKNIVVVRQIL